jgi:osmotically-inducible protein OsmY
MNWRDERLAFQIGRALADIGLTQGCELDVLVCEGSVFLVGELVLVRDFDAVLGALVSVPGVRQVKTYVAVGEVIWLSDDRGPGAQDN